VCPLSKHETGRQAIMLWFKDEERGRTRSAVNVGEGSVDQVDRVAEALARKN